MLSYSLRFLCRNILIGHRSKLLQQRDKSLASFLEGIRTEYLSGPNTFMEIQHFSMSRPEIPFDVQIV